MRNTPHAASHFGKKVVIDGLKFANQNRYETCDLNLCDDCAHRHNGFDFCPNHWRLLQLAKKRGSFKLKGE